MPGWGRRFTVPCPECGLPTHRHRTLDFGGATQYGKSWRPVVTVGGESAEEDGAWVALIPGDFPARLFAQAELFHLVSGIAWPGAHHRDYGSAKVAHNACCPAAHTDRPDSSRGAGELWQAMRLRIARSERGGAG
ncbi:DUF6083 domain-containing protein [Streptomyces mirabilis]|uniref:DUF6083 domain-containing protein n=1 Tax=Streptomyces mirabilis TaxID=68239 RepID=UPI00368608A0